MSELKSQIALLPGREIYIKAEVYLKSEADKVITELKDKCQMHDFFWDGCAFAKRGFKNRNKTFQNSETINYCPMCGRKLKETK